MLYVYGTGCIIHGFAVILPYRDCKSRRAPSAAAGASRPQQPLQAWLLGHELTIPIKRMVQLPNQGWDMHDIWAQSSPHMWLCNICFILLYDTQNARFARARGAKAAWASFYHRKRHLETHVFPTRRAHKNHKMACIEARYHTCGHISPGWERLFGKGSVEDQHPEFHA